MDKVLLISEYISQHESDKTDSDHLTIVDGEITEWSFAVIPVPTEEDLLALEPVVQARLDKQNRIALGKKARVACEQCLDFIAGHNLELNLTAEQITTMQSTFANIQSALMTNRPSTAKALITALNPDEVIVTTDLKNSVLEILAEF